MAKEVTKEFGLKPEEAVVKRADEIEVGSSIGSRNNELVLTDKALYHIKKNLFGKTKEVVRYPLEDICMANGKPQVVLQINNNVTGTIDIYLPYETLHFGVGFKDEAREWHACIMETITGEKVERKNSMEEDFGDLLAFADTVTGSVNGLRKAFGIKSTEQVACKCSSCGASLSGTVDEVVICPYCGTSNKMVNA